MVTVETIDSRYVHIVHMWMNTVCPDCHRQTIDSTLHYITQPTHTHILQHNIHTHTHPHTPTLTHAHVQTHFHTYTEGDTCLIIYTILRLIHLDIDYCY